MFWRLEMHAKIHHSYLVWCAPFMEDVHASGVPHMYCTMWATGKYKDWHLKS